MDLPPPNAASVALIDRGRVLLIERAFAPYKGLWTLPGGRCEPGESAEDCARREVEEETGLRAFALRQVMVQSLESRSGSWRLAVFATEGFEGEIVPSTEIAAWQWVRPEALGALRTTSRLDLVLERAFGLFDRR
ncbi:NUDIX domain-containing protein [Arsenicitalea aurantiaca]|uniref:NUDIX domain-containing protein n=1 Tax=Arsenicitalea aurantiaca TaxID=1783274 RepID=A0A433XAM0_9HYPH|nr:NUDIX domain-containing protein [Arsenicitalea aurantiaca]RUT31126.1 NUDIX domain-containing protein [Arsenicitalea aurantiaca]